MAHLKGGEWRRSFIGARQLGLRCFWKLAKMGIQFRILDGAQTLFAVAKDVDSPPFCIIGAENSDKTLWSLLECHSEGEKVHYFTTLRKARAYASRLLLKTNSCYLFAIAKRPLTQRQAR